MTWKPRLFGAALAWFAAASTPAAAQSVPGKPFRVVTTFTVIQDIAQNVAGDKAIVISITKPGAEIHDYQPTPLDIVRAQSADLVLWNGFNLERWFEKFFDNVKEVPSVVVTEGIEPMGISEGPYSGKPNPHAWMSPSNALVYVENIRKALAKFDPKNADTYNRNAAAYAAKIKAMDEPLRKRLSDRYRKVNAGWSRAKAPSAIRPATITCGKLTFGRSTPTNKARRSRCAR